MDQNSINLALSGIDHINMLARKHEGLRNRIDHAGDRNKSVFSGTTKISLEPIEATDESLRKFTGPDWHPSKTALTFLGAMMLACCIIL